MGRVRAAPREPEPRDAGTDASGADAGASPATCGERTPLELVAEGDRTVHLTREQAERLVEICVRHRRSLPIYLQSAQREMEEIDSLIAKLR